MNVDNCIKYEEFLTSLLFSYKILSKIHSTTINSRKNNTSNKSLLFYLSYIFYKL